MLYLQTYDLLVITLGYQGMQWLQDTFAALTAEDSGQAPTDTAPETKYTALTLQKDGQLSREQLLAFFSSASKVMKAENFRRKLKDARLLKQV